MQDVPFDEIAIALAEMARDERARLRIEQWHAIRGHFAPPPGCSFQGWERRLVAIDSAAVVVAGLVRFEPAIRLMLPGPLPAARPVTQS